MGRVIRKGHVMHNVRAIKEIFGEIGYKWQDHYGFTIEEEIPEMPNDKIEDNLLQCVDDQVLDEKILNVKGNGNWSL